MSRIRTFALVALFAFLSGDIGAAEQVNLRVVGWNVESGDSNNQTVAQRIADEDGVDIWGLSEVPGDAAAQVYEQGAEDGEDADFERIVGTTGGSDRLAIIYSTKRLDKIGPTIELSEINPGGTGRSPLAAKFKGKTTGQEFIFMVNHLFRGDVSKRHLQARKLNEWAGQQEVPVIAVGDYNFDFHVVTGDNPNHRDKGFDFITENDAFVWVRPETLVKTQASAGFNTVLDFVFVAGTATGWTAKSTILVKPGDFPDDAQKSDHRPVEAVFTLDVTPPPVETTIKAKLLQRIEKLEQELQTLRQLVEGME